MRPDRILISLLCAGACCAQTVATANASSTMGVARGSMTVPVRGMSALLEGAPFSGEQVMRMVQTLADGTHITRNSGSQRMYRDSAGRTRTERALGPVSANNGVRLFYAEIRDPVARLGYVLDTVHKIAYRFTLEPSANGQYTYRITAPPANAAQVHEVSSISVMSDGTERKTEYLGEQMIDGVLAEGRKTTTTYAKGYQGASAPIVATSETWSARSLGISILSKTNDPRSGESTQKWENVKLTDPEPLLFQVPPDYKIVDAAGSTVTISYEIQR